MRHLILTCVLFCIPVFASAHGGQPSLEKEVGNYFIDIGYDQVGMRPGEEVSFDIDLYTQSGTLAFADFSDVELSITQGTTVVTSATVHNTTETVPTWKYTFAEGGAYQLNVRYLKDTQELVTASFDLHVGENDGWLGRDMNTANIIAAVLLTCFALFIAVRSFLYSRKSSAEH